MKRVNWVAKWSLIEEEYLQPKRMRTRATEQQTLASDYSISMPKQWTYLKKKHFQNQDLQSQSGWIIYSPEQVYNWLLLLNIAELVTTVMIHGDTENR